MKIAAGAKMTAVAIAIHQSLSTNRCRRNSSNCGLSSSGSVTRAACESCSTCCLELIELSSP